MSEEKREYKVKNKGVEIDYADMTIDASTLKTRERDIYSKRANLMVYRGAIDGLIRSYMLISSKLCHNEIVSIYNDNDNKRPNEIRKIKSALLDHLKEEAELEKKIKTLEQAYEKDEGFPCREYVVSL